LVPGITQRYFFAAAGLASLFLLAPYAGCHIVTTSPKVAEQDHEADSHRGEQRVADEPGATGASTTTSPATDLNDIERFLAE
jgi:hypothetical protein